MTSPDIQIERIRSQTLERIAEITAQPKPSYSIDGQAVSWSEYLKQLQNTVQWCDTKISENEITVVISQGTC